MLVEIHILQNHSPSNVNRDDLGAPKTAYFGNTLRARISSQCIKRSIRTSELLCEALSNYLGQRTKYFPEQIGLALAKEPALSDEAECKKIVAACERIGDDKESKSEEGDINRPHTGQLIFLGPKEVEAFVKALARLKISMPSDYKLFLKKGEVASKKEDVDSDADGDEKKEGKEGKAKKADKNPSDAFWKDLRKSYDGHAVDIALFGRMTTSDAFENVEASMQVSHAISTNEVRPEVDYFTAMDDLQTAGQTGSAHIGETQFNSATYYKYFSLDWSAFVKALGGEKPDAQALKLAEEALAAFVEAAVAAVPSGKRNSFANSNFPDGVLVEVKERNVATNYANAFLKPAEPEKDADLMHVSQLMLIDYVQRIANTFGVKADRKWLSTYRDKKSERALPLADEECAKTLQDLVAWIIKTIQDKRGAK